MKSVSIVIPIFNEAASLNELYTRICKVFESQLSDYNFEIVFVDDGSTDITIEILNSIITKDYRVKLTIKQINMGKSHALMSGFVTASGDIIVTMDGDLQDRPESIPALIQELKQGYDLVIGYKKVRSDSGARRLASKIFNTVVNYTWKLGLHDINSGLKAISLPLVKSLEIRKNEHRFIPVFAKLAGFSITEVAVQHDPRKYGKSRYGLTRFFVGLRTYIFLLYRTKIFKQKSL